MVTSLTRNSTLSRTTIGQRDLGIVVLWVSGGRISYEQGTPVAMPVGRSTVLALLPRIRAYRTVGYEGFVASDIRWLRDQICTTLGPEISCVKKFDFG